MSNQPKKQFICPESRLKDNSNIDKLVINQYHELEKQLNKLGVDTKPRYTLSPPFGGISDFYQRKQPT